MKRFLVAVGAVILLGSPAAVFATKVKVWHHHAPAHYDKAQLRQAVVSSEGALRLSRQLRPLVGLEAARVWDVVEDGNGNLYAATGDDGKLYRVAANGLAEVVPLAGDNSQILCLAAAPDGTVYAGAGPSGRIYRITPNGAARVHYETGDAYVWSLALDAAGTTLFAGAGPKGRIHRITPDGRGDVFYATRQDHILALAVGPDGMLYAGSDKDGLIYRIDHTGKGFVLYNAPQSEIRCLLVTPEAIYAGTSAPTRRRGVGTASGAGVGEAPGFSGSVGGPAIRRLDEGANAGERKPESLQPAAPAADQDRSKAAPAPTPAPAPPGPGENSVYRINPDGTVREVFREKAMILSLSRQNDRLFVGTGMEGRLFEIDETTRERSEIARLDHGQIHCMYKRNDGSFVIGAGDPGKLYVLQDKFAPRGVVLSEILDAKIISRWGALRWQADLPPGAAVSVAVRTGNVAEPDETWSDWSAEETDPRQAVVRAPTARFLQYRVTLAADDASVTPVLRSLAIRYMTTNLPPEVAAIDVPNLDAVNLDNPKKLKIKWTAFDPNEDELVFQVHVRKEGWPSWVLIEDNLDKREFEWDLTTVPSGVYQVKVTASDRKDNPEEEALTGERVSAPFPVSHTPPTVAVRVVGVEKGQAIIEAAATQPMVRLTAASYSLNGQPWVNVFPRDGLFDSKSEQFRFQTPTLKDGTQVLVLRVTDAAGNTGAGDIVFTVSDGPIR